MSIPPTRTTFFFVAVFAITWGLQLPAAFAVTGNLAGPVERWMPLAGLGIFGPTLAAVLATWRERQPGGVRALFGQLRMGRVGAGWYLGALLGPGALLVAGLAIHGAATGSAGTWLYLPSDPQRVVALLLIPFAEEIGWRGYALPRLQQRFGPLPASLVLGVLWALWHVPMFLAAGLTLDIVPLMTVFFVAGSVFFTWIFNRTGGSLLVAVVAHMGAHLNNSHLALPGDATPVVVHTAAWVMLALALVAFDRTAWRAPGTAAALERG